ncbi:C-GCAxxG-C-C family protein [Saccharicrinis sp. FJH62]|uniref:C-GCAxxG-C-C family protein n=1 Tax=Saccharicrinis sp. FJH62 TaxID=3344657 RepID=UPI0035D4E74D
MKPQSKSEYAVAVFSDDNNCAQSVLVPFGTEKGLSQSQCIQIASGFGGGIAMSGLTCGAVTGAIMALGLAGTGEGKSKELTYEQSKELMQMFEEKFGSIQCKILTEPKQNDDTKHFCDKFVSEAASMVEDILKREMNG